MVISLNNRQEFFPFMLVSYGFLKTIQTKWFFIARERDTSRDINNSK